MCSTACSSQGCGLGLETYERLVSVSSRRKLSWSRKANVSVSAIDTSCPRTIFRQILQLKLIKLIKSVIAVNESLADLVKNRHEIWQSQVDHLDHCNRQISDWK